MSKGTIGSVVGIMMVIAIGSAAVADESRRVTGEGSAIGCLEPDNGAARDIELAEGLLCLRAEEDAAVSAGQLCVAPAVARRIGGYTYRVAHQPGWNCLSRETVHASARFACIETAPPAPPEEDPCVKECVRLGGNYGRCFVRCNGW